MIYLTRKPIALLAFRLDTPNDMLDALATLIAQGWRGQINFDDTGGYRMEANADNPTRQIIAAIGDVLIDDLGWRLLSASQATDNYDEDTAE